MTRMISTIASCLLLANLSVGQNPEKFELTAEEKLILELTNAARKNADLPALTANPKLAKAARAHSLNQAKQDKLEHELDGKKPSDRVVAAGYRYRTVGENVAMGSKNVTVEEIFDGWMKSPGHRANILSAKYTQLGVGTGATSEGKRYYTQVFGAPAK